jgi:CubicO group peptidase (beta-lactamase class C family)
LASGICGRGEKIPHTLNTQFSIGSVSKQFTAVALLMALKENEEDLTRALQRTLSCYLPSFDAPWVNKITLHQLLTHTSGLDNYTDFSFREKMKLINDGPDARNQHIALIKTFTQDPTKIDRYNYSNTNYNLLSLVIEEVTGETLRDYMDKVIFTPLGMKDTVCFGGSSNDILKKEGILPNVAYGYVLDLRKSAIEKSPCKIYENYGASAGDGSIVSTVADLHTWCVDLFRNNRVVSKAISSLICQPHVLDPSWIDEGTCWYGYGMGRHDCKNLLLNDFWHDGLTYGYSSFMSYFPNLDAIYIELSNFAENYFISSKEIDVVYQQHPNLDESPESEKFIMDALEKRYPGYGNRLKSITPDIVGKLRGYLRNGGLVQNG